MTPDTEKLVYDVGLHTGEDTGVYLSRGCRVVAVEANPDLVKAAKTNFADAIATGQLTLVAAAIAEHDGSVRLGIAESRTIWSSLDPAFIERNKRIGERYRYVDVPSMRFERLIEKYGMPYYLKIDIEGLDMLCVRALRHFDSPPPFISLESHVSINRANGTLVFDELAQLWSLGYRQFRYANQASGQTVPFDSDSGWHSISRTLCVAQLLRAQQNLFGFNGRLVYRKPFGSYRHWRARIGRPVGWYDIQAKL